MLLTLAELTKKGSCDSYLGGVFTSVLQPLRLEKHLKTSILKTS